MSSFLSYSLTYYYKTGLFVQHHSNLEKNLHLWLDLCVISKTQPNIGRYTDTYGHNRKDNFELVNIFCNLPRQYQMKWYTFLPFQLTCKVMWNSALCSFPDRQTLIRKKKIPEHKKEWVLHDPKRNLASGENRKKTKKLCDVHGIGFDLRLGLFSPEFDFTEQHNSRKDLLNLTNPFLIIRTTKEE